MQTTKHQFLLLALFLLSCQLIPSLGNPMKSNITDLLNTFTINFNQIIHQTPQKENVIFSPINIYTALAMLHLGANHKSRSEIANLIGFPADENQAQQLHEVLSQNLKHIENTTKATTYNELSGVLEDNSITDINIADGIFVQNGVNLKQSFVSKTKSLYKGEVANLDFAKEPKIATDKINQYISKNTKGKIPNLLTTPVSTDTRIILTTVLNFKGSWHDEFASLNTKEENFKTDSGNVAVKMMKNVEEIPYIQLPRIKANAIEIPYAGFDASMYIILPNVDQPIDDLIKSLNDQVMKETVEKSQNSHSYVEYKIPKMKFKWSEDIDKQLKILGIQEVFSNQADLSNMVDEPLFVSQVTHAAEIEVNEKGTEASAATLIRMQLLSLKRHPKPIEFHANRPFVFIIHHRSTDTILFFGVVRNPNK